MAKRVSVALPIARSSTMSPRRIAHIRAAALMLPLDQRDEGRRGAVIAAPSAMRGTAAKPAEIRPAAFGSNRKQELG